MEPPEIILVNNFISNPNELFETISNKVQWDRRLQTRKTASFGVSYNYSGLTYPQTAMLDELTTICRKIRHEIGFLPNNCLLNYYCDGNSTMGYHSDTAEDLLKDTGVVIISLGAARHICYRSKREQVS